MHLPIEPAILYFGTPVVLISTLNEDGTLNVAPISSIWWLGWTCLIGLDGSSKTTENLSRTGECVLNLPSGAQVAEVDAIARTTGRQKIPLHKKALGYSYEKDKLSKMGFNAIASENIKTPRLKECPVQLEAELVKKEGIGLSSKKLCVPVFSFELNILKVYAEETILKKDHSHHVDPDLWHPLIMNFRKYYTTSGYIHESRLSAGSEDNYAPWKKTGFKRKIMEFLLLRSTKKYR